MKTSIKARVVDFISGTGVRSIQQAIERNHGGLGQPSLERDATRCLPVAIQPYLGMLVRKLLVGRDRLFNDLNIGIDRIEYGNI